MRESIFVFVTWILSIYFETTFFSTFFWFHPNLLLLFPILFCLRWRGSETYFIALIFGLTADCFSTIPFGSYGLVFFIFSFLVRWYAITIYHESLINLHIIVGLSTVICNLIVLILMVLIFDHNDFSLNWFGQQILFETIPTLLITFVFDWIFIKIELRFRIRLSERKY